MRFISAYLIIIGIFIGHSCYCQHSDLRSIDNLLTSVYKKMKTAYHLDLRYDSMPHGFKQKLTKFLTNPITFYNSLDSLSKYLDITISADKQIKFYSWVDIGSGSWHNIVCLAQFKATNRKIIVQQLNIREDDSENFTDSGIYEVNEINYNGTKFYLTFGSGTHGSGHWHKIVQIFSIANDKLVKCKSCFANKRDLVVECQRGDNSNLAFNPKTKEITHCEFAYADSVGIYRSTGRKIFLKFDKGIFR